MNAGLRAGYKQTEVGVIPEDWEVKRIGDIASVGSGGTPRREVAAYWGGSIPWVTTSQVDFGAISEAGQFITDEGLQNSPAKLLPPGTLLMALYGQGKTRGKVGVLAMQAATNQACASISLYQGVSREFVLHFLTSRYEQIRKSSNSGSQENLNGNIVKGLLIASPSPTEQRAIALALSDVDALLAGLDRLIAKKRDLKQAAMQQLLTGQTRLPGFQGEWEVKRLDEAADPADRWSFTGGPFGSNLKSSDYTDTGIPIIQLQNIGDGEFLGPCNIFTSPTKADDLISCNIYPGEIILSKMGDPVARACIIPQTHKRYLMCSDGIRLAVDRRRFDPYFVFTMINAPAFRQAAANAGTGSTRKRIGLTELRSLQMKFPLLPEQTAIATFLYDMDAELTALEARRDKTRGLKQAMMQELLTGRIRLV